jgi:sporulation protein YtfJ
MMAEHPIEGLMKTTMDSIKEMVDVNTIVGDPVQTNNGEIIIPISKVSIGFASGGAEYSADEKHIEDKNRYPFGGGSGAGMSVQPVAFLIVGKENIKLLPVNQTNSVDRIIDGVPQLLEEIMGFFRKDKDKNKNGNDETYNAS